MFDILIEIITELFGNKPPPTARPRRPARPAGGGAAARRPAPMPSADSRSEAPDGGFAEFGDMVRRMLGGEETEAAESRPPSSPPETMTRRREAPAATQPSPVPAIASGKTEVIRHPPTPESIYEPPPAAPRPPAKAAPARVTELPDFVKKLRNNPRAAREALVYAEIFGPPLADR